MTRQIPLSYASSCHASHGSRGASLRSIATLPVLWCGIAAALIFAACPTSGRAQEYLGGELRLVAHFDIGELTPGNSIRQPSDAPSQSNSAGAIHYSNLDTPTGGTFSQGPAATVSGNGITRLVADDITGIPGGDVIEITFSVANQNAVTVTCRARLRFWSANGTGGLPGTYMGSVGLTFPAFSFPPGVTIAAGRLPAGIFPMPGSKFWAGIAFDNENNTTGATLAQLGNMGQALYDPPTLGSSSDVLFETTSAGSFLGVNNPAGARVSQASGPKVSTGWKFTDVPYSVTVRGNTLQLPNDLLPVERPIPRVLVQAWRDQAELTAPAYADLNGVYSITNTLPFQSSDIVRVTASNDWLNVQDPTGEPPGVPTRESPMTGTTLAFQFGYIGDGLNAYYIAEAYGRKFWKEHIARGVPTLATSYRINVNMPPDFKPNPAGKTLKKLGGASTAPTAAGCTSNFITGLAAYQDAVCHEFVHAMFIEKFGHVLSMQGATSAAETNRAAAGVDEGLADYFTYAYTGRPDFCKGCPGGARPLNPLFPAKMPWCRDAYADQSGGYRTGQAVSGALYDLRQDLGVPDFGQPTPPGVLSAQDFDQWIFDAVTALYNMPVDDRTPMHLRYQLEARIAYASQVVSSFEEHNIKPEPDNQTPFCLFHPQATAVTRSIVGSSQAISLEWTSVPGANYYRVYSGYGEDTMGLGPGDLVADSIGTTSFSYTDPDSSARIILTVVPVDSTETEGNPSAPLDTQKLSLLTGVGDLPGTAVSARLSAWPTPFSTKLALRGVVPEGGRVSLTVYDVNGRQVKRVWSGSSGDLGGIVTEWDGRNEARQRVSEGIYFVRLTGSRTVVQKKVMLLR